MNAVQLALGTWGFGRVVIVGVPLSGPYEVFREAWLGMSRYAHRIRALSGYTAQIFGRPNAAFVE